MRNVRFLCLALLFVFGAANMRAECPEPEKKPEDCSVNELVGKFHDLELAKLNRAAADAEKQAAGDVEKKVGNVNKATTAPDAFAARIHNSYQDFIAPFSFAINKVEESKDGQSLIVRFNMIRQPPFVLGFTGTVAKPTLYEPLTKNIAESVRSNAVDGLNKKLNDFDDITLASSFAVETKECPDLDVFCMGRNPQTYRNALAKGLMPLLERNAGPTVEADAANDELDFFVEDKGVDRDKPLTQATSDADVRKKIIALAKATGPVNASDSATAIAALRKAGIDNLAALIDNQPQLAFTGSWHQRGTLGGPDEMAATAEFQWGFNNLHAVGKRARNTAAKGRAANFDQALQTELENTLKQDPKKQASDKLVFTASYKRVKRFDRTSLTDFGVTEFTPLTVPRTSEVQAKAQWGRRLGVEMKDQQQPRIDISGEFNRASKGGVRNTNRFVGTITLTVPATATSSIPISLKYANKPEFLTEERKQLSVHFGISYRLPWEPAPK